MASLFSRADRDLQRLDRKVGKLATYKAFVSAATNTATGVVTRTFTDTEDIKVRAYRLDLTDRSALANAGLANVEAAWKIRKAYIDDPKTDDEVHLTDTGFKYIVIDTNSDRVEADHILYTRRLRL